MTDCFGIGPALACALSRLLPIGNGLRDQASCGVMLCGQLRLGRDRLGKLFHQHLRDLLMQLLAPTLEQGLIRCILHQRVFEEIAGLGRNATLIDELSLD
jgi:hypothetical protein